VPHLLPDAFGPRVGAQLLDKGATSFGFICPGEELPGMRPCEGGAFAYLLNPAHDATEGKTACYFPIAGAGGKPALS
jgi:hypothetical protein